MRLNKLNPGMTGILGAKQIISPLDLSDGAVATYWKKSGIPNVFSTLKEMDSKEEWPKKAFRDPFVDVEFQELLRKLGDENLSDENIIASMNELVLIMAYLNSSKCIRMIRWLEQERENVFYAFVRHLTTVVENHGSTDEKGYFMSEGLILHRLQQFKKLLLLNNIFSEERQNTISAALKAFEKAEYENS